MKEEVYFLTSNKEYRTETLKVKGFKQMSIFKCIGSATKQSQQK